MGLLEEEPAGVISTRNAGCAEFEATLEWPPWRERRASVLPALPAAQDGIRCSLRESAGTDLTTVYGSLFCLDEEILGSALEQTLHAIASAATLREAALSTRVLRAGRVWSPEPGAVQALARRLWGSGVRVGFGSSWSPALQEVDVMLGCLSRREEMVRALGGYVGEEAVVRVDCVGVTG